MAAKIASTLPYPMEVKKGQRYLFCACGLSDTQPYCNHACAGSTHSNPSIAKLDDSGRSDFPEPITYVASRDQIVFFCGCKQSAKLPICDGSHIKLTSRAPR